MPPLSSATMSSTADNTEPSVPFTASQTSSQITSHSSAVSSYSVTGIVLHTIQPSSTVTDTASYDGTGSYETSSTLSSTVQLPSGTLEPLDTSTSTVFFKENTTNPFSQSPAQYTDYVPAATTSESLLIPSLHSSTKPSPQQNDNTSLSVTISLTTEDASRQTMSGWTTEMNPQTLTPWVGLEWSMPTTARSRKAVTPVTDSPATVNGKYSVTPAPQLPTSTLSGTTTTVPVSPCSSNPCQNGGRCTENRIQSTFQCECPPAWQGTHCHRDVDECLSDPCPPQTTCSNIKGSFSCRCPLGYILQKGTGCILVRTFLGQINVPHIVRNGSGRKYANLHEIEEAIVSILSSSFASINGYYRSMVTNSR
ncbi:HEG homolog 1 [Pelobates cultripes]|uniref:HEG homolog 1 n=2 Tax=Pelobates cultripes TaxID=61616 RepID=A0AAD1WGP2_PELCU|nr:HEG homolog 1 [Pelobates cultripes]